MVSIIPNSSLSIMPKTTADYDKTTKSFVFNGTYVRAAVGRSYPINITLSGASADLTVSSNA
jgi:hypothetical protein